jgi:membrane protein DedA with SNARE-associated domain
MDALRPHLELLHTHLYAAVFVASVIDATGVPFPGRLMLVVAGALAGGGAELSTVILLAIAGAVLGDHALYLAGRARGDALLALYCRLTLRSPHCVDRALQFFKQYGAAAIAIGRFSTVVRLFAAVMAGSGAVSYARFVVYDLAGTVVYSTLWAVLGYLVGAQVARLLTQLGPARVFLFLVPIVLLGIAVHYARRRQRRAAADGTPLA